jgi:hypothetical protein
MQPADSSQIGQRPRFPALDPEPPPHPWRRVGATLIVLLVGLGSWLGYSSLSGTASRHHSTAVPVSFVRGLTGVVLAETPGSYLSATDMQTGKAVVFKSLGEFSSTPNLAVSADGKYLLDPAVGRLLSLASPGHPQTVPNALSFSPGDMPGFMADPWTDDNSGVVELSYPMVAGGLLEATVPVAAVESVRTGRTKSLGQADSAAGDPQRVGAFIAVPKRGPALPDGNQPDSKLVLADAGARSRVLATAAQLDHVLGIKPGTAVSLVPLPNPQGSMVAVQVTVTGSAGNTITETAGGIVVLSRNGALLGSQPGSGGLGWTGWSHAGRTLAFVGYSRAGAELVEWTVGARSVTTVLHGSSQVGPTACVWSPDDAAVICDGGPRGNWLVIRSGTESATAGQGQPLEWANGGLGA